MIPEKPSTELAEETGLHIGDGTMNFYKSGNKIKGSYALRGHLFDDREHYEKRIRHLYKELYGFIPSLREMPSTGCYGFQKWSDEIVKFKHEVLKLPLGKKTNIKIPEQFVARHVENVIRGIFDTDGNIYLEKKNGKLYPRIHISNVSLTLINQLGLMAKAKEIRATTYTEKRKNILWLDIHRMETRGEEMLLKWFKIIQPANYKHIAKYQKYLDKA